MTNISNEKLSESIIVKKPDNTYQMPMFHHNITE